MSCQQVIDFRPECSKPYPSQVPAAPEQSQVPGTGAPQIEIHPKAPPIFGDGPDSMLFGGMLPIPEDLTWARVLDVLTLVGAVAAAVLLLAVAFMVPATYLGWKPAKLRNWTIGALLALPGSAIVFGLDLAAPSIQFSSGASEFLSGRYVHGLAVMAVFIVPAAWMLATLAITNRRVQLATRGMASPAVTERMLWLQTQREQRAAARLSRYRLPFTTGGMAPHPVIGRLAAEDTAAPPRSRWRALLARNETRLIVPWIKLREHMIVVASSGKGKTTLMFRLIMAWFTTAWLRHRKWWSLDRPGRPLAVVVDCNGGPESMKAARRFAKCFAALGVPQERIGIFPADVQLDLWAIPSRDDLRSVLTAMVTGGAVPTTATEKYFHEIRENLIHLVVDAPQKVVDGKPVGENPPRDWLEFLSRFNPVKLAKLWGGVFDTTNKIPWAGVPGADLKIAATLEGKQPVMSSTLAEFNNLYRALGNAFDGKRHITDFDALYIVLEGVKAPDRARSQFAALGCMFEQLADQDHGRETLLAVDEFSAVSDGKTNAVKWVERLRKAKIGTIWFAQHWNGLGADDDQRTSLVGAGSGGALLGGQEDGEKLAKTFGTKRGFEFSRKQIDGTRDGAEGNVQGQDKWLIDPNRLRRMAKGDIVHVSGGRARWGRVAPLDDAALSALRPLPGLADMKATAKTPDQLAPVIDLRKHRTA
ncbi:hypothetical protein IU450_38630 [Nocardia abscessus]|uniref:hypothetical protein n=1 Tax=Nocardia abscessus TaxID=120957 RepID=UPI001895A90E|nr:hypothetical protein [Nocardia abscessus]MBF6341753.1 hypothetical protein [Nocardia abscessus]